MINPEELLDPNDFMPRLLDEPITVDDVELTEREVL
jgi:hypothetical protein